MEKDKGLSQETKNEKSKLHVKYIVGISIAISAITIVAACYNNSKFVDQVSFAGTISSIILSVIAIIMTIIGESKSDNTKDTLLNLSKELELIVNNVNTSTEKLEKAVINKDYLDKMESKIIEKVDNLPNVWSLSDNSNNEVNNNNSYTIVMKGYVEKANTLDKDFGKYFFATLYYIALMLKTPKKNVTYDNFIKFMSRSELNDKGFLDMAWYNCFVFSPVMNISCLDKEMFEYISSYINENHSDIKKFIDLNYDK